MTIIAQLEDNYNNKILNARTSGKSREECHNRVAVEYCIPAVPVVSTFLR